MYLQFLVKRTDIWQYCWYFLPFFLLFHAVNRVIEPFGLFFLEVEVYFELSRRAVLFKLIKLVKHIIIVVIKCNGKCDGSDGRSFGVNCWLYVGKRRLVLRNEEGKQGETM